MARTLRRANVGAWACAAAVSLLLAGVAAAQTTRAIRVDYAVDGAGPEGACPDEASFEGQVRARSARVSVSPDGATSVRVRIAPRGAHFQGDVAIVDPRGREARRRVEGSCADVAAALALITALALDPTASTAPEAPSPAPATSVAQAASASPSAAPAPAPPATPAPDAKKPAEARPEYAAPATEHEAAGEGQSSRHAWAWSIGAEAGLTGGVAPQLLFSVPVFVDVSRRTPDLFAPAARVRFERSDSGTVSVAGAGADFTWTAGSADLCPIAWSPWRFRFWPCARVEAGVLQAAGSSVSPTRSSTRPWLTAGAALRGRLAIYGGLFAEIEGTAFVPIVRDRFYVEPSTTIQRAPVVAAAGAAGLGVSFW